MPAYHLLYPMLEIEFMGNVAYLKGYYDSEFTIVRRICKKRGDIKECFEQYLTVDAEAIPRGLIDPRRVSFADRLQAITLYIAKHIRESYLYTKKGFINRNAPVKTMKTRVIKADAELRIYKGFRTEYYVIDKTLAKFRVSVVPVFEFEIVPTISEIIRKNIDEDVSYEYILMKLGDVDLSTIPEYWRRGIGPKYAGTFQGFYNPSHPEYEAKFRRIERYYKYEKKKEGKDYWHEVESLCQNVKNDFIVSVEKYWQGKKTHNDYFGCLLLLTPSLETLSLFLEHRDLEMVHSMMRPKPKRPKKPRNGRVFRKDYWEFYNEIRETTEEYMSFLQDISLIKVRDNAIVE